MTALATLTNATRMLAEARTLDEVKGIKDIATAAAAYAHARGLGEEAETYAAEIRLEASRRIGQFLVQAKEAGEIDKGGRPPENRSQPVTGFGLTALGISKNESAASQTLAHIPDEEWGAVKEAAAKRLQTERSVATQRKKETRRKAKQTATRDAPVPGKVSEDYLNKLVLGDARQVALPHGIKLLFTDPPYGMNFQSNRRVVSSKAERIAGDQDGQTALELLGDVLRRMIPNLADDAFVLVWCAWRQQCGTMALLEELGLTVREEVIWNKPNHSSGDLLGAPARKHEKFLFAVKGNPKLAGDRFETVLSGREFVGSDHPTEKPLDLIATVIQSCTEPGDLVADPFMGSGSVPLVALREGRDFWGCELSSEWHGEACASLMNLLEG